MSSHALDSVYAWIDKFVEATTHLTCDVFDLVIGSLSTTLSDAVSDNSQSRSSSSSPSTDNTQDQAQSNLSQSFLEFADWFFDYNDFQLLLIKLFIAAIIGNCCMIYVLWNYWGYGEIISEHLAANKTTQDPEDIKKKLLNLNLPTEFSQQHS
ncbi:hypothetical protein TKK_0003560 [Trichogramma kaykai]